jgi:hypothetical protein
MGWLVNTIRSLVASSNLYDAKLKNYVLREFASTTKIVLKENYMYNPQN